MPTEIQLLAHGRTAEIYTWEKGQVLKLYRPGFQENLPEYEQQMMRAVVAAGIPAPQVGELVIHQGRKGLPMTRIHGESQFAALRSHFWRAADYGRVLAGLQAQMHAAPGAGLPSLRPRLESKIRHADPLPPDLRQAVLDALARLPEGDKLCHGDFHPDNVIETKDGPVIIDWVDATCGAPLADVARTALLVRYGSLPPGNPLNALLSLVRGVFYNAYLRRYFELAPGSPAEVAAWLPVVAAARLSERIASEENNLLRIASRLLKR